MIPTTISPATVSPAPVADPLALRRLLAHVPTAIAAVAGVVDGRPDGMVVASFTGVSLDPPLASICIQNSSRTWRRLRGVRQLGISVLADDQGAHVKSLSSASGDRFEGVAHHAVDDAVLIHGATVGFTARVVHEVTHGDHLVVMLELGGATTGEGRPPLVFHGSALKSLAA